MKATWEYDFNPYPVLGTFSRKPFIKLAHKIMVWIGAEHIIYDNGINKVFSLCAKQQAEEHVDATYELQ